MRYQDQVIIRKDQIDQVSEWYWLQDDYGAWDGPKHDWIDSHSTKYFEHVKKFDSVVQAGGCLGMYPKLLSFKFKTVYTFEPDPLNFYCLKLNCESRPNVIAHNVALGEESKSVQLAHRDSTNVGMHHVIDSPGEVQMMRLDDCLIHDCDLLCLDVEGHETRVLLGAIGLIAKFSPVVVCENGNQNTYNILRSFGYDIVDQSVSDTIYARK